MLETRMQWKGKSWMRFWGGKSVLPGCAYMTSAACQMISNVTIWLCGSSAKAGRRGLTYRAWILFWTCPRFTEVLINAHPKGFHHFVYLFSLEPLMLLPQHCTPRADHTSSSPSISVELCRFQSLWWICLGAQSLFIWNAAASVLSPH